MHQEELPIIMSVKPNKFLPAGLNIFGVHCSSFWESESHCLSHSPFETFHYSLSTSIRKEGGKEEEVKFETPNVISVLVSKLCWSELGADTEINDHTKLFWLS